MRWQCIVTNSGRCSYPHTAESENKLGNVRRCKITHVFTPSFSVMFLKNFSAAKSNHYLSLSLFWRGCVFKIGTGYAAGSKTQASRNQFQFVSQIFPWCHPSIRASLISLDRARMKVCCAQSQWTPLSRNPPQASLASKGRNRDDSQLRAAIARRRVVPSRWSGCQSTQNVSNNTLSGIKYRICHICVNFVGLCEKNWTKFRNVPLNVEKVQTILEETDKTL
jgi:hypothetical protein